MSKKSRLEKIEERLNVNKDKGLLLIEIREKGARACPLEEKELQKCKVFQEKAKKAGIVCGKATTLLFNVNLSKYPGEQRPVILLDCQEKCPYTPTREGDKSK